GVKQLDKQIEKQEALLSELRDFEARLRRATNLHLEPDLDDGVVPNTLPSSGNWSPGRRRRRTGTSCWRASTSGRRSGYDCVPMTMVE
ncbi:MAG: hypothetical protein JO116_02525, partial [Planctomycetaceae bacterium]|nr:hypothetical protein [Planctomycetaceae bacterium]